MNISRIIERWAAFQPSKTAVHFRGHDITYREMWRRIDDASAVLASRLKVQRGDRVAYLGYNHPEIMVLLFAVARIGAMLVPINVRLAPSEYHAILKHAEAKWLFIGKEFHDETKTLREALPGMTLLSLDVPDASSEGCLSWNTLRADKPLAEACGSDSDPVIIIYTSGTTGMPKGAVHTQSGLIWNAINSTQLHDLTNSDHVLTAMPMFHAGGLFVQTFPALHMGATVTLHPRFEAGAWITDVAARRPTLSVLVPATMQAIERHPEWGQADLSSLRSITSGSSTVPASLIARFQKRGLTVVQVYGATETGPVSIYLRAEDATRKIGSAGKTAIHVEVRLVTADDSDAPLGTVGEIHVRAPSVMQGYWKAPDDPSFCDGWFKSGDLAYQDEEGFYFVVGRSKDMIISGGENIYAAELENVLADCQAISEAAVVGLEDPKWGEVAVAVIVRNTDADLDTASVLRLFEGRLARYKHPRLVLFVDSLPRNPAGKLNRVDLRRTVADLSQKT